MSGDPSGFSLPPGTLEPLKIDPAPRGRKVRLTGSIQVKPDSPMKVDFRARRKRSADVSNAVAAAGFFVLLVACVHAVRYALSKVGN